jgi:hypothetical protein
LLFCRQKSSKTLSRLFVPVYICFKLVKMHLAACLVSMAAVAKAVSVNLDRRALSLDVKLEMAGNTAVKAIITNNGAGDLKIFKTGTLLEDIATEKINVFQAGKPFRTI